MLLASSEPASRRRRTPGGHWHRQVRLLIRVYQYDPYKTKTRSATVIVKFIWL